MIAGLSITQTTALCSAVLLSWTPISSEVFKAHTANHQRSYLADIPEHIGENGLTLLWVPGQEIWIQFRGGSAYQKRMVREIAVEWTQHANLKFVFDKPDYAHVRIGFGSSGHWSLVGRECTRIPQEQITMNLNLKETDSRENWSRVVLHEFGHMLGLEHEHQNPCGNPIRFTSRRDVIDYYRRTLGWDESDIKRNILDRTVNPTYCWLFDPRSIMLYDIPTSVRVDDTDLIRNHRLSEEDKAFAQFLYP